MPDQYGIPTDDEIKGMGPENRNKSRTAATPAKAAEVAPPPGQWLEDPNLGPAADYVRKGLIALNQYGVGVIGDAATAGQMGWNLARLAYPNIGEAPAVFNAQGPGGYINRYTVSGLTPHTPTERVIATGAQGAGSSFFEGPVGMGVNALAAGGGQLAREYGAPEGVATAINTAGAALSAPSAFSRWSPLSGLASRVGGYTVAAPTPFSQRAGLVAGGLGLAAGGAGGATTGAVPPAGAPGYGAAGPGGVDAGIWGNIISEPITRHITDRYGVMPGMVSSLALGGLGYYLGGKGMGLVGSGVNPWTIGARVAAKVAGGFYAAHAMNQQGYPSSAPAGQPYQPPPMTYEAPSSFSPPMQ